MKDNIYTRYPSTSGYTLIEIVLVIVLMTILAGFGIQGLMQAISVYTVSTRDYLLNFQEGKIAMEKMAREIREASPDNIIIGDGSIQIVKSFGHGTPQDPSLTITFVQANDDTTIERQSAAGNFTLVDNVVDDSFSAHTDGNNVVTIYFAVEAGENYYPLRTAVWPRLPVEP